METFSHQGTNRYRLVSGFHRFLNDECGVSLATQYLGIRDYDESKISEGARLGTTATIGVPTLHQLYARIAQGDGVIILFGSYKPDPKQDDRLERVGGHYVAVVGYGEGPDGHEAGKIVLHDSNDSFAGRKYVQGSTVDTPTELWDDGERLIRSRHLVRLDNAPIRQDGRIAFLETIFTFRAQPALP